MYLIGIVLHLIQSNAEAPSHGGSNYDSTNTPATDISNTIKALGFKEVTTDHGPYIICI